MTRRGLLQALSGLMVVPVVAARQPERFVQPPIEGMFTYPRVQPATSCRTVMGVAARDVRRGQWVEIVVAGPVEVFCGRD
jgi:hypothetical protein